MKSLLLTNGRIVNEGHINERDLLIVDHRIERIDGQIAADASAVIDLAGRYVLPGIIDDQVHFRDPGFPQKGTIGTESRAAVCGGVTSYFDMPNTKPATVDRQALAAKKAAAAEKSYANYGFYLGATNDNLEEIKRVRHSDACGIKVFMGASTGNMLVDDKEVLSAIFAEAPLLVVTHCEDSPMIWAAEKEYRARYGEAVPMSEHPAIRSAEACYKSSSLAVELARQHGTDLHVLHLTTARELSLFEPGKIDRKQITVEACIHHLWFDDSDYERLGSWIKCNPAIKSAADRQGLLSAVRDDVIDILATDHAPHTREEKERTYFDAPSGLPLVQHFLLAMLEQHKRGEYTLEVLVEKACHNPAVRFGVEGRGFLREGNYADIAVVDLNGTTSVVPEALQYQCGWSPFEGTTFGAEIMLTIVNGSIVFRDGQITGPPRGQEIQFGPRRV